MAIATAKPTARRAPSPAEQRFLKLTPRSRRAYEKTSPLIPGATPGGLDFSFPYPQFIKRAEGCYVWDADGRRLVDMMNGDWLLPLGHGNAKVVAAIAAQLAKGTTFGAPDPDLGYRMASLLRKRMPSMERMRFTTSGTEATQNALRVARAYTSRPKIAKMRGGYHGTHDASLIANGRHPDPNFVPPGLIPGTKDNVLLLPFNDPDGCERIIEREKGNLAAVITEPVMGAAGMLPATRDFLRRLRAVTQRYGIVLILDEVVTMTMTPGGAQGYYGVKPDLTTLGKAIGGGLPLGAFGGRADLMDLVDPALHRNAPPVRHGSTFGGIPITLAAGIAALHQLTPSAHRKLQALGDYTRGSVEKLARKHEAPLQITGAGHFFGLHWTPTKVVDYDTALTSDRRVVKNLVLSLRNEGYFMFGIGVGVLSLPMTTRHIDRFIVALERAMQENGLVEK